MQSVASVRIVKHRQREDGITSQFSVFPSLAGSPPSLLRLWTPPLLITFQTQSSSSPLVVLFTPAVANTLLLSRSWRVPERLWAALSNPCRAAPCCEVSRPLHHFACLLVTAHQPNPHYCLTNPWTRDNRGYPEARYTIPRLTTPFPYTQRASLVGARLRCCL
jgi:hypothetical protein